MPPDWPGKLLTGGHNHITGVSIVFTLTAATLQPTRTFFYEKVKKAISEKIAAGVWRPHDRIPSEAELVAQYGFSRMTINRALRELTDEGLLVRLQGVGTFVAEPKGQSALFEIRSIADEIAARNHHAAGARKTRKRFND